MDKYEGVWKSDFLIGPGIVNTKFIKYDRFIPLIEHLLLDVEEFEKHHDYFVAGIELDYFNQCKVFKHKDHINFDNRRIRIFLPVQINDDEIKSPAQLLLEIKSIILKMVNWYLIVPKNILQKLMERASH